MPASQRARRALVLRIVRNTAVSAVAVWLIYVVAGNLLLSTGAIERIVSGHGGNQLLQIGSASTFWFGRVQARDLTLRIQDSSMECLIVAPEADLSISLSHLPLRTFHASRVEIRGLKLLFRAKVDKIRGIEQRASAWPPIPGLPDPPLKPARAEALPDLKQIYKAWSVHLEGINAEVDELWMEEFRYRGKGLAAGAFLLRPQRMVEIMDAAVDLWEGTLAIGPHTVIEYPRIGIRARVRPFDPMAARGRQVFEEFSGRLLIEGTVPDVAFASVYLTPKPLKSIRSGPGRIDVDLTMVDGKIAPASSLMLSARDVDAAAGPVRITSDLRLQAQTVEHGEGATAFVHTSESRIWNNRGTSMDAGPLTIPEANLSLGVDRIDLTKAINPVWAELSVPEANVDARWINGLAGAPAKWHAVQGLVNASIDVKFDPERKWRGNTRVSVSNGRAGGNGWSVGGNLSINASANAGADGENGSIAKVEIAADDVRMVAKGRDESGVWLRAAVEQGTWQGFPPKASEAVVHLSAGPGGDVLRMITGEGFFARIGVGLAGAKQVTAVARARMRQGHKELELVSADAGAVEASGSWVNGQGRFLVRSGPLSAGISMGRGRTGDKRTEGGDK